MFFGSQAIGQGLAVIYLFLTTLVCIAALFYQMNKPAGLLMIPTCLWVGVASSLNLAIYLLNRPAETRKSGQK